MDYGAIGEGLMRVDVLINWENDSNMWTATSGAVQLAAEDASLTSLKNRIPPLVAKLSGLRVEDWTSSHWRANTHLDTGSIQRRIGNDGRAGRILRTRVGKDRKATYQKLT